MFAIDMMNRDGEWDALALLETVEEAIEWAVFARRVLGLKVRIYEWRC